MRMQVMRANWSTLVVAASLVFGGLLASQPLTDGAFLSWDVGPTRILAPSGNVDSGAVFTPQVRVRNFGDSTVSFPVYLRIGPNYADTQGVTDLAGGDSIVVSFDPWTALVRWTNGIICSTALSMDENPTNDRESASVYVRIRDVGVSRLVAPLGIVDSGVAVTPRAVIKNYGTGTQSFNVRFTIGSSYTSNRTVNNLAAGDSTTVSFTNWTPQQTGYYATKCSTMLSTDIVPDNNAKSDSVLVAVRDVGVTRILAPLGTVDSGVAVTPRVEVANFGGAAASFPVILRIGSAYVDTEQVTDLGTGETTAVTFADWLPGQVGVFSVRCSTALSADRNPANNLAMDSVEVRRSSLDVAVLSILAPIGTVDSGTTTMPGTMVKNQGTETVSFTATFRIGDFYSNTQSVRNLGPGESTRVDFDPWIARQPGTHVTLCTTALSGDEVPENNIKSGSVTVRINHTDVSVRRLVTPSGTIDSGLTVTPLAWVRNVGDTMASFPVVLTIGSYYLDTTYVSDLAVGESLSVSFDPWTALVRGAAIAKCSTAATDRNPANDWDTNAVSVRVRDVGVTRIVTPVGIIDSGTTLYPQATVRNFGTAAASFSVRFQIDTFYNVTANVNNLAAGASQTVYFFPGWTASQMGPHVVKCSTQYASDSVAWNNLMVDSCNVIRVTDDVGVVRIVAPTGIVDSGAEVVPQAMVRNYSDSTKSFPVLFRIGATYADTQVVTDLLPNDSLLVSFQSWTASVLGTSVTKCSTMLDGDQAPANNARADSVRVMIITIDLGATQILAPVGTVDSGAVINPKAIVKNLGAGTVDSFAVMMRINVTGIPSWRDTQYVRNLAPGESVEVTFRAWTATWVGTNNVRCSTMLSTDQRPSNNRFWTTITVQRPPQADVGVARIVAPTGTVGAGTVVVPQVMVYNYSQFDVSFPVWFRIDTLPAPALAVPNARSEHVGQVLARSAPASNPAALLAPLAIYEESVWVSLAGGDSTLAEFLRWTANPPGNYYLTSFTALVGDGNRRNDSAFGMVSVVAPVHDVGAVAVLDPVGLVNQGDTIAPRAVVRNFGTQAESFVVRFYVGRDWRDSLAVRVEAGAEESLSFRPWVATMVGTFPVVCSTALTDDGNPDNDRMVDSVFVVATGTAEPRPTRLPVRAMLNVSPSMTFSGTRVFYGLPREQQYRIEVFDLGGHLVQTLARGRAMPGYYAVVWNGLDLRGRPAARGIYVCRLVTEDASLAAKFVKLE